MRCVLRARQVLERNGISGEVIVSGNDSKVRARVSRLRLAQS